MTRRSSTHDRGFTLLELLVALVVFGFVLAGLGQGVRFGFQAWDRQARGIEARDDLDAVDRTLVTLFTRLDPMAGVVGGPHAVTFVSELPVMTQLENRQADLLLQVDARHRLVLRWTPHLHAKRLAPPPLPRESVLLDNVDRLDVSYWGRNGPVGWLGAWQDNDPPALVRLRLVFGPADPRSWPDIVAAVMRDRPDG